MGKKRRVSFLVVVLALVVAMLLSACTPQKQGGDAPMNDGKNAQTDPGKDVDKKDGADDKVSSSTQKVEISAAKLLQNKNARYAFAMAVDKEYIQDILLNNGSIAANYLVAKGLSVNEQGEDFRDAYPEGFIPFDSQKAKEYWQKAKEELKFDVVTIDLLCYDIDDFRKVAEFMQSQFETNLEGVSVHLNVQPLKNKIELSKAKKFDIDSAGWGPDYADAMTFLDMWTSDNSYNNMGFASKDYDDVIRSAKIGELAKNPQKRLEELRRVEKMFLEEAYLVPLFQRGRVWLRSRKLEGLVINQLSPEIFIRYMDIKADEGEKKIFRMAIDSDLVSLDHTKATDTYSFSIPVKIGRASEGKSVLEV